MRSALIIAPVVFAFGLSACGGTDDSSAGSQTTADDKDLLTWTSEAFNVPVGESFECFYTDIVTDRELSVLSAAAEQGPGGHHVTVYYVDNKREPHHDSCSGTSEMVDWHFVVGAGGEGNGLGDLIQLADGLAIKIPAGKQLMVQAHYINTSGKERMQTDKVKIELADPTKVKAYASDFVIDNDKFEVKPNATTEVTSTCTIKDDLQLTMLLGHMHEHGAHYTLERVDEAGKSLETVIDNEWQPSFASHPPILLYTMEEPLAFAKGTKLRQTCKWNNNSTETFIFPTEMCIGFGYYFPGNGRIMCEITE